MTTAFRCGINHAPVDCGGIELISAPALQTDLRSLIEDAHVVATKYARARDLGSEANSQHPGFPYAVHLYGDKKNTGRHHDIGI